METGEGISKLGSLVFGLGLLVMLRLTEIESRLGAVSLPIIFL